MGHREAHAGEEAAATPLADVPLGLVVGLGRSRSDDVDTEFAGDSFKLALGH